MTAEVIVDRDMGFAHTDFGIVRLTGAWERLPSVLIRRVLSRHVLQAMWDTGLEVEALRATIRDSGDIAFRYLFRLPEECAKRLISGEAP